MTTQVLFAARPEGWSSYEEPLRRALDATGLGYALATDLPPASVDYIVYAPNSPVQDFSPFTRLKAVLNLWAGVEDVVHNETLTVPLARMVDQGLTQGMLEWVTGHCLRYHLGIDYFLARQDGTWDKRVPPLAQNRTIGILGLGVLGVACAQALQGLGFSVAGWSRSPKSIEGVKTHHGADGLQKVLSSAEIVVLLLPDTPATANLIDGDALAQLPNGAFLLNPGRGTLIDDDALFAALGAGQIAHATLDVFRTEPLPPDHPYWAHPRVTITPHIASETRPETAAQVIAENVRRGENGEPFLHLVDRSAGY